MSRELDLILFGATGFTGKLVAEVLAQGGTRLRWGIGGRNREKLEQLRVELDLPSLPLAVHDSLDAASMTALARRARVICSTVGPYAKWGTPLVAACAAEGTHYCDLTGEPDWVRMMIDAYHEAAVARGARIVPSCGFDSIPSDLGVLLLGEHFAKQGRRLASARLRVTSVRGAASGGSIATALAIAERMRDPAVRRVVGNPYALNPEGERQGPDRNEPIQPRRDLSTGHWLAPFVMAAANTRVVRRSNALAGYPWGRDFHYEEVVDTGAGASGLARATALSAAMVALGAAAAVGPGLMARFLPSPGQGPSRETRERGRFRITIDGVGDDGSTARAHVAADRDPGYGATAVILAEAALCLAEDDLPPRAGLLTPATAMGDVLVERLRAAGVRCEIES
jgi:short subunit dehydrogenase-like uncharacterized protein